MYPFYTGYKKEVKLDYDDIQGIQKIYGGKRKPEKPTEAPKRKPDPEPVPTKKPVPKVPLNKRCPKGTITALWTYRPAKSYMLVTEDERLYTVHKNGAGIMHANIDAKAYYRGIPGKIDAIYQTSWNYYLGMNTTRIYDMIFSGNNYYQYEGFRRISGPHPLQNLTKSYQIGRIDAAMKWWPNHKVYFFSGDRYWRYNEITARVDHGYPKLIRHGWNGVPGKVDAAYCSYESKETFFIVKDLIYRMQERPWPVRVKPGYPRPLKSDLLKCKDLHYFWAHQM
jgi:hypothetical protein